MIDLSQWKQYVVLPTLNDFDTLAKMGGKLNAVWAVNQVVGTTKESNGCEYLVQLNDGPARGFYQMEPATHDDIWTNFLAYQTQIANAIKSIVGRSNLGVGCADQMIGDIIYSTLMCRIDYYRSKLPAPANTATALANYHKTVYNTSAGASVAADDVAYYQQAIDA